VLDPEKGDLEAASQRVPQDIDGPVSHPGVLTTKDNEYPKREETDEDSIHSHSSLGTIEAIPEETAEPQRSKSKSSSVRSRPLSIIPRSKRRGLLARFTIIPEVERPYDYNRSTKWLITLQVALAAAAAPMGSAILLRKSYSRRLLGSILTLSSCSPSTGNRPP
jgi:hypothetical protein